jgi:hypothetical protein
MIRHLKQKPKSKLTINWDIVVVLILTLAMVVLGIIKEDRRRVNREAYAKVYGCTWHATGTWYGDDRDFVCK